MPEHFPRVPTSEMIKMEPEPMALLSKPGNGQRADLPLDSIAASSNETLEYSPDDYDDQISMKEPTQDDNPEDEKKSFIHVTVTEKKAEEELKAKPDKPNCLKSSLGVVLGLTSGLANSLVALLVKLIKSIGVFEVAVFRYVVMLVPLIVTLGFKRMNPFQLKLVKASGFMLVLRALVGAASTYFKYFALRRMPLADASVILFSSPVFASVLARIFLKEPFQLVHGGAIIISLGGCVLVSRPSFIFGENPDHHPMANVSFNGGFSDSFNGSLDGSFNGSFNATVNANHSANDHMWGCLSALASAIFSASVFVTVRHMKAVDSTIVLFWTAFVGLMISVVATAAVDHFIFPTDLKEIVYIVGVGILTLVSQEALTRALKLESAGLISLLRTGDIVWSFIWQVIVYHEIPHYFSIIGALMVVFCVSFISLREAAEKMPPQSKLGQVIRKINRTMDGASSCSCCRKKRHYEPATQTITTGGT